MVKGLEKFKDYFSEFSEQYVLIGGAACDLAMSDAGMEFRGTKDLDISIMCRSAKHRIRQGILGIC